MIKVWIGNNPELSEKVQNHAIKLGYSWPLGEVVPRRLDMPVLCFDHDEDDEFSAKNITCTPENRMEYLLGKHDDANTVRLSASEFLLTNGDETYDGSDRLTEDEQEQTKGSNESK